MDRPEGVSVRLIAPAPPSSFPHSYKLFYVVSLMKHQLSTDLHIHNTGDEIFNFHALFHTYFAVPDVSKITITGLDKGVQYRDKAAGQKMAISSGEPLKIDKETDR